ncbi:hypothetical protein ACWD3I_49210 [Streptomyces sp. NPDC002817]|uniref:hypothetical protein n=1 Tax=Streptomyces sp. NPDC088357 TaxID=3154655 RepID=UPI00342FC4D6
MAATYYCADSENGHHIDDPSEDALFDLISELDTADNTFVIIQPDEDDPAWFASVAVLDEGGYEIVRRDSTRREHEVTTDNRIGLIANDLIIWLAARDFPGRPAQQTNSF